MDYKAVLNKSHGMIDYLPALPVQRLLYKIVRPGRYRMVEESRKNIYEDWGSWYPLFKNRALFVHVPKAAGVSVVSSLFGVAISIGHTRYRTFRILLNDDEINNFFKFTFVRNPFDRLVSAYEFLQKGGLTDQDRTWADRKISKYNGFGDFVKGWFDDLNVYSYYHFIPQHEFVCFRNRIAVNYVGYYETLVDDYNYVQKKLKIGSPLMALNSRKDRVDYRAYYDSETIDIVSKVYKKDLDLFGYDFDGIANRISV